MSKAKAQRRHARARALERYGVEVGPDTLRRIIADIQGGRSVVVQKQSLRVTVHDVEVDGTRMRVVYDRQRKELATFLPLT